MPVISLTKMFKEIRPRVNLEFFDEEYVKTLVFENLIIDNLLEEIQRWWKKISNEIPSTREHKRLRKTVKKDAKRIPDEWIELLNKLCDYLSMKRNSLNKKIGLLKPIIKELKHHRKS